MTIPSAFAAIEKGDLDALTAALDGGTDPNARDGEGRTLLMEAVYFNRSHMVDVLLSRGADIHEKDPHGWTALHWAANEIRSDVFRTVFSAAGPRAMEFPNLCGRTPLHFLVDSGSAEQMAFALSHPGIDVSVSIQDVFRRTPLDVFRRTLWDDRAALQTYGHQEARWQPMRYTWIKLLMIPTYMTTMRVKFFTDDSVAAMMCVS
jgi:hypothetical protein